MLISRIHQLLLLIHELLALDLFPRPLGARRLLTRRQELELGRVERLHKDAAVGRVVELGEDAVQGLTDAEESRGGALCVAAVEDDGLLLFDVEVQQLILQTPIEEVAAHERRPAEGAELPGQLLAPLADLDLVPVDLQPLQRLGMGSVAAPPVGGDEALDTGAGSSVREPQMVLEPVRQRKGGDDGVMASEGFGELGDGEVAVDVLDRDERIVCVRRLGGGVGAVEDGDAVLG